MAEPSDLTTSENGTEYILAAPMGAKFNSLTVVIFTPFTVKSKLLSRVQISIRNSSGKPVMLCDILAPDAISNLDNKGATPGAGHSTISKIPSLSSSKSILSVIPSPSESKQVLKVLSIAFE